MKMKPIYLLGILFLALIGCKNNTSEIYLGTYRGMDQLIPYPFILEAKNDSLSFFDNQGELLDKILKRNIETGDTLFFKENHLLIGKKRNEHFWAYDLRDTTSFKFFEKGTPNPKSAAKFQKIEQTIKLDTLAIKKSLLNNIWSYEVIEDENKNPNQDLKINHTLHFKKDSLYLLTNYFYKGEKVTSEYQTKGYYVYQINETIFLSYDKGNDNPQPIFQITKSTSNKIELKDFSSTEVKLITYEKSNININEFLKVISETRMYANCYDGYQGEYYFDDDVTYKKGNNYILDFVSKNMPNNENTEGYIIVHFSINCEGVLGDFGLIQMDKQYKKNEFSQEIVTHIITKVVGLKGWPSSVSTLNWLFYKDVHAFLMFKIENGKITDLCP